MILRNLTLAGTTADAPYGLIPDGAIWIEGGLIRWLGRETDLPEEASGLASEDLQGRLVTPGLIDCHTHMVFGGNRAAEFEMRLNGASYEDIAKSGGGIVSTVAATRDASEAGLLTDALGRVDHLISEGVTTVEIKSGYGLDIETELKMLRVARQVGQERSIQVKTTFLGAHALPKEHKNDPDGYIANACLPALELAVQEGLVDAVDGFCETIAFSPEQLEPVFEKAKSMGLPVKLHAEQLSHMGGAQLATRHCALSADHLEYATEDDAVLMANAGTVAVILPGAFYTLKETQAPPIEAFRKHKVPMALATDCNPGSSPMTSLLLTMNMGCTLFGMTPEEAFWGVTRDAAAALGLCDCGTLAEGHSADLAVWDVSHPAELAYRIGFNPLHRRICKGAG